MKKDSDNNTIGLILCKEKNKLSVEWSLEGALNPIGVSSYEIDKYLPTTTDINNHINLDDI